MKNFKFILAIIIAFSSLQGYAQECPAPAVATGAGALGAQATQSGDVLSYNLTAGSQYVFELCGSDATVDGDSQMDLWDAGFANSIAADDDGCGLFSTITYVACAAETVNVAVYQFSCITTGGEGWTLTVTETPNVGILGCTVLCDANYNPLATCDDGSCAGTADTPGYAACAGCGEDGTFRDAGAAAADYVSNADNTYTICPEVGAGPVAVTFDNFSVENSTNDCWDQLNIFDGNSTAATPILPTNPLTTETGWCWDLDDATPNGSGDLNGQTITSTDASGCLTFQFTSDSSATREGWCAIVENACAPCIPTMGTWAMIILSLNLMIFSVVAIRRKELAI